MEKAYDFKELVKRMKGIGLEVAEESAKASVEVVLDWYIDSAKLSTTPLDDIGVAFVPHLKVQLKNLAEGINPND